MGALLGKMEPFPDLTPLFGFCCAFCGAGLLVVVAVLLVIYRFRGDQPDDT